MIPCCAAEQLPQPTSAEALQLQRGWGLKIKLTHIEELWMGRLGLNFWKEYKWLQVCQLLLHPSVTEYSTAQGNGAWLGTVCAAWWGTVLLFVSNGYFHGKTVFSCNFTSALCRVSSYLFFIPKEKAEFQGFFFAYSLKSFGNNYGKKKATAVKSNAASELVGSLLALQATSAVTEHGELGQELGQQGSKVEPSKINPKP